MEPERNVRRGLQTERTVSRDAGHELQSYSSGRYCEARCIPLPCVSNPGATTFCVLVKLEDEGSAVKVDRRRCGACDGDMLMLRG